ncbi:uncharacterized protein B0I36DRAFT_271236 [Microdochium trichocladiopsis]|uniref:DNA repair protein RAD50 n=1 Tax=Microdochium trichocladiopsis TaxID=1682393 RepID=A0A9P9BNQ2_9PEZI|nr:uncharacterized protein B0I36DRAFT_271236 [Microdochium trichocladiopsis]KAH7027669.1 hypothetical protein B0I36DRAFT_271236 [Microdochium trichocladiopsis]
MSKIEKLSISGVRSFSPMTRETIQFNTPLTLIVGYNGSGKTTIIECLKYVTTGELPPNSKGGAFIHDPKLVGEREVMAQVKLKFKTPPDTSHVVTRSIQLSVKKTQRSQKTLEGSISTTREGEKTSLSSKVVELDTLVPASLGVSAAILDAVIFCHQDESLWPMSEPSALKKRFDEIFEAMKYTKAIENLKLLRKKQGEQLTQLKIHETQDKTNKEKADRCERRSVGLQEEIEALRVQCEQTTEQIEGAERAAKKLYQDANRYLGIVNELRDKERHLEYRTRTAEETKARMDEIKQSDEWLRDTLAQYEERAARLQQDYHENLEQQNDYQTQLSQARGDLSNRQAERGRLESDRDKYERQIESRVELIHSAARSHNIRGFDSDLDDSKVQAFQERVQKLLSDKKRELERLQKENADDLDSKTGVITELEGRKAARTQDRVFAKQRIGAVDKRSLALQKDLNAVEIDEGAKAVLDSGFADLGQRLSKTNEDLQAADLDNKLQSENDHLQQLEVESNKLGRELVECTRLASDRAQLDYRKNELAEKKKKLDTLSSTWTDKVTNMLGGAWQPETVEKQHQTVVQSKQKVLDEAMQKRDQTLQNQKQVQYTLKDAKERAKKREDEIAKCKAAVLSVLQQANPEESPSMDDFSATVNKFEDDVLTLEKDIALSGEMTKYYEKCQKTLSKRNCCELCSRAFVDDAEKSRLVKKIKEALAGIDREDWKAELAEYETILGSLRAVRPQSEMYNKLILEKPLQERELQSLLEKDEGIVRQLEQLDEVVREKQDNLQDAQSMGRTIQSISQLWKDIAEAEIQVDRIMSQQQSGGSIRSVEEINELQHDCNVKMRASKDKISRLSAERQRMRDLISALELERSEFRNKISNAVRQLERKQDLQNQIQSLKEDANAQREAIQQADKDLEAIEPEIAKARTIREDTLQKGRAKEGRVAEERDGLAGTVAELKMASSDIEDYLSRGGPSALISNERAIQALKQNISRLEKDIADLATRIDKVKAEMANSTGNKKNIMDNLSYRESIKEISTLEGEIEELESRNAEEDYDRLHLEAKSEESKRDMLTAERASMMGSMKTKDEELARLLVEWETDYQDAARRYRETHIKVETTKAAIEDLGRYGQALNNAIMRYHALKMEEVNRIIGELWQATYQGTDIDTILIKSDTEATSRGTYNYRVCMVKQDTEMDMRGRCSAGQKVLASIIIRLALAETFGTSCGLIALDEPTTNLDRDNIKSLAESLHSIIKTRKAQSNFQLIVITHDEEFLRHMRCSDFCDYFFRVARDEDQKSTIRQESISSVI